MPTIHHPTALTQPPSTSTSLVRRIVWLTLALAALALLFFITESWAIFMRDLLLLSS